MTTENTVETPAETQTTAEEVTEQPEVVTPEATDDAGQPPKSDAPAKTPEQIEVERLRRAMTKRDRTQGAMHRELEQLRAQVARQPVQQAEEGAQPPAEDIRKLVEREAMTLAERIAGQKEFTAKCNSVAANGGKEFPDFKTSLDALIDEAGPLVTQDGRATALGEQILESDTPHALINYLGKHPEIAAELDGLTPGRLARKLVSIELEMKAKPKASTAPKPLEPVRGQGAGTKDPSAMTDAEFNAWRKSQIAQRH